MNTKAWHPACALLQILPRALHVQGVSTDALTNTAESSSILLHSVGHSDQMLSSDEECSCEIWAMSRGGFIIKPKCKLQGSLLARALTRKVPFECQFSLSTVKQPLNHYLKKFCDSKLNKCSSKVDKAE